MLQFYLINSAVTLLIAWIRQNESINLLINLVHWQKLKLKIILSISPHGILRYYLFVLPFVVFFCFLRVWFRHAFILPNSYLSIIVPQLSAENLREIVLKKVHCNFSYSICTLHTQLTRQHVCEQRKLLSPALKTS